MLRPAMSTALCAAKTRVGALSTALCRHGSVRAASSVVTAPDGAGAAGRALLREGAFVDGRVAQAASGAMYEVLDPGSGDVLGTAPDMDAGDTAAAVDVAAAAFDGWRNETAPARAAALRRWFELVNENSEGLAELVTLESGKPLAESRGEVMYGGNFLEWFGEEAKRDYGLTIPSNAASKRFITIKQPVGVAALITPWNFPIAMITRKAGAAVAAGCSVVIKPGEDTPYSAVALAELATEAGIPPGVVNVVTSSRANAPAVGGELCTNKTVKKLSFTGSTAVGKLLTRQCADTMKRVSMELGGNAPFIVFDDADLEAAVQGAIICKFRNTGQTCVCANRIFVQAGIYDEFSKLLAERVSEFTIGHGLGDGVNFGPLINEGGLKKSLAHIEDAQSHGGTLLVGGERIGSSGSFLSPAVITGATSDMLMYSEETFGPVAGLFKFSTEDEVVAMANDTDVGLAGYVYTRDVGRVWRMGESLEVGMVGLNEGIISAESIPFGGVKESGLGREGGAIGMDEYTEHKYLCMGGI